MAQAATSQTERPELVRGALKFPEPEGEIRRTSREALEQALKDLQARKQEWVSLSLEERIQILDAIRRDLWTVSEEWIAVSMKEKGVSPGTFAETEEWASFWPLTRGLRLIRQSLDDIRQLGRPRIPGPITKAPSGQVVAQVLPATAIERILFQGLTAEVWMEPGLAVDEVRAGQAAPYFEADLAGKVALVLGAGNVAFLPYGQMMEKLFGQLQVVILKLNPVNDYLGPLMERAFKSLIDPGFLRIVYGGREEGSYLANHPLVDEIQLTGSDKTFESLVFGSGAEGARRKAARDPMLRKPIEAELGNVSPVIVVPGSWSRADLTYQAKQLATWQAANAGHYCLTPRVIIQHRAWELRDELLQRIGSVFSGVETRKAYYPGSERIHEEFLETHPQARQFGAPAEGHLPWTLIPDVDPTHDGDLAFNAEGFCSLFAETALEGASTPEYLENAVAFANETLWGTLCATILVHPESLRDPATAAAIERAIAELRYGTVTVNYFTGVAAACMVTPWGGYPNGDIYDIQSGTGVINNVYMFSRTQKSVFRAPFRRWPDPFLATAKRAHVFARRLACYDAAPSIWQVPGLLVSAVLS